MPNGSPPNGSGPGSDGTAAMAAKEEERPQDPDEPGAAGEDGEQEPEGESVPTLAGARRPVSPLGWVVFPFAVVWRFLFPTKPRPFIVELPFLVVFALFLAFLIKTFLVQAYWIPSGSMQNTLAINDRVLVNRAS
ncbi:MAG TPA: S26 family signal peptidase, partial [Actinocrinis sp.]